MKTMLMVEIQTAWVKHTVPTLPTVLFRAPVPGLICPGEGVHRAKEVPAARSQNMLRGTRVQNPLPRGPPARPLHPL